MYFPGHWTSVAQELNVSNTVTLFNFLARLYQQAAGLLVWRRSGSQPTDRDDWESPETLRKELNILWALRVRVIDEICSQQSDSSLLNLTKADNNDTQQQKAWLKKSIWRALAIYESEPPYVLFHMGVGVSLVLAARPHFSRACFSFFSFLPHASTSGLQLPILFLFSLRLFLSNSLLCSPFWHWLCLSSLLPYVHTLFKNLQSENAIIECLSIQLDHRDMLFLPISFAPFRRLNNVCVSGTSTLLDVGGCRWESSVCQVCH